MHTGLGLAWFNSNPTNMEILWKSYIFVDSPKHSPPTYILYNDLSNSMNYSTCLPFITQFFFYQWSHNGRWIDKHLTDNS